MDKAPLICFYKNDLYFYSDDFEYNQIKITFSQENLYKSLLELQTLNCSEKPILLQLSYPYKSEMLIDFYKPKSYQLCKLSDIITTTKVTLDFSPMISKQKYVDQFNQVMRAIHTGDLYQMNLTFPFKSVCKDSAFDIFSYYSALFSGDYFALLPGKNESTICFSPELFIHHKGNKLRTRPIKGTCSSEENIENLLFSSKESAELSMIVDLLRNDLNRVATISGAKVRSHRELLNIGNIIHTYSEIECETDLNIAKILSTVFPGGSVTGCPKISAIKHIEAIESYPRGAYTGCAGWIYQDESLFNILIRSFFYNSTRGDIRYHSGGGIVVDSQCESEFKEVLLKASRL